MAQNYFFFQNEIKKKLNTESVELDENGKKTSENLWNSATAVLV